MVDEPNLGAEGLRISPCLGADANARGPLTVVSAGLRRGEILGLRWRDVVEVGLEFAAIGPEMLVAPRPAELVPKCCDRGEELSRVVIRAPDQVGAKRKAGQADVAALEIVEQAIGNPRPARVAETASRSNSFPSAHRLGRELVLGR